jgi:O-antigen ligase
MQDLWVLGLAICIANVCRTPEALGVILRTWAYSAIIWAALLLVGEIGGISYLTGLKPEEGGRTSLTLGDANIAAHYFFVSIMIVAATRCPPQRLARVLAYALLLSAWALSGSNSGIVQLLLAIVLIGLLGIYRRCGAVPAIAAACCLLTVGAVLVPRVPIARIQSAAHDSQYRVIRDWVGRSEKSAKQRELVVSESIDLYYDGGLLGQGPASTIHRLDARQANLAREAHNDYLASLIERGLVGAVAIVLLLASVSLRAWSVARRPLSATFARVVPSTAPLLGAVAGTFVLATVYEVLHTRHVWALFAVVAALYYWGRE